MECQSVDEALEACAAGAEIVMLDNFTSDRIGEAAQQVKDKYPHVLVEASGVSTYDSLLIMYQRHCMVHISTMQSFICMIYSYVLYIC